MNNNIIPKEYTINITPNYTNNTFNGVTILLLNIISNPNNTISLNASQNFNIQSVSLKNTTSTYKHINTSNKNDILTLTFESLPINDCVLTITYTSPITTEPIGIYSYIENNKTIITTQFEPTYANKMFPCFDHPNFKAIFNMEIVVPKDKLVLSNTDIKTQTNIGNNILYKFHPTPIMSTYLVALYIGYSTYIEQYTKKNVRLRVYSPYNKEYSKLALETSILCMDYLTEYFNFDYPINKLDLISIKHFNALGMENFGLITFLNKGLICDPDTCVNGKITIIITICHELAHQWFGNITTMSSWNDLWLNESFATYISYIAAHHIYPTLNIKNIFFIDDYLTALTMDSLINTHPIYSSNMDPIESFDVITYSKGASIINMLVEYIGPTLFKSSIQYYINKFAYKNTTTNDLWDSINQITNKNIKQIMEPWINQQNYPLITIKQYDKTHFQISQTPFTFGNNNNKSIWDIPLCKDVLLSKQTQIFPKSIFKTKINFNVFGFYNIFYDDNILNHIIDKKLIMLQDIDIANLLSNQYFLLKSNKITCKYYFTIINKILKKSKISKIIIDTLKNNYINFKMITTNKIYANYYKYIITKYIQDNFFIIDPTDDFNTIMLKTSIYNLGSMCKIPTFIDYAKMLFETNTINKHINISQTIYIIGIKYLDKFNLLLNQFIKNNDQQIASSLGFTKKVDEYNKILNLTQNKNISIQNKIKLFQSLGKNKKLNYLLWPFIKNNWQNIFDTFKNNGLNKIIMSMVLLNDYSYVNDINKFFNNKDKFGIDNSLKILVEIIKNNHDFNVVCA